MSDKERPGHEKGQKVVHNVPTGKYQVVDAEGRVVSEHDTIEAAQDALAGKAPKGPKYTGGSGY